MAEAITVARPYAEAVYKHAVANDSLSQWSKILQLAGMIAEDNDMRSLIGNPIISAKQLGEIFLEIGKSKFNSEARNLVMLLAENKRISILPQISQLFEQLKAQHEGVLEAKIASAFALEGKQLKKLVDDLEQKFKRKIEAQVSVDPELIGGIKVEIGDEILDASVRGKLEAMAIALKS
ncbi:MAG: F0F1 ATP synthase subunit delta [Nitrosomonadaceae bacterium]|uniref:F0F1 ATP synthase subunit delta n=1 Tax=unclassified Nitrosomonas TaxID=2609265 RepID=UPI001043443D|nr:MULTISPECIES: F0F1 ATP synthase subunit delta [unclassified Nitrosomonas]MDV6340374.1 F0F1 ATP synthase subunit delta [Nitrosomonas sp. Is24]MDV6346139.1 F0F1 ATP synthase subunit delta [Nitrosomonas sp. Is35]NBQ68445.1 F0F1 ATP synthase subunit delta [Nitrosomonadaceae bacterium]